MYSMFIGLQITMTQRSLSVYFRSLVHPLPHVMRKDVIEMLIFFRLKGELTSGRDKKHTTTRKKHVPHCF